MCDDCYHGNKISVSLLPPTLKLYPSGIFIYMWYGIQVGESEKVFGSDCNVKGFENDTCCFCFLFGGMEVFFLYLHFLFPHYPPQTYQDGLLWYLQILADLEDAQIREGREQERDIK